MAFSYGSGVVEDAFDNPSGLGSYDFGGNDTGIFDNPSFDYDRTGEFELPGLSGTGLLGRSRSSGGINSISKVLDALNKANAYKSQSGSGTSSTGSGGTFQKIDDNLSIYFPPPRQKITGGTSGGGLGSAIGGIAGTALSLIPGVGPIGTALLPKVGSTLGGLIG